MNQGHSIDHCVSRVHWSVHVEIIVFICGVYVKRNLSSPIAFDFPKKSKSRTFPCRRRREMSTALFSCSLSLSLDGDDELKWLGLVRSSSLLTFDHHLFGLPANREEIAFSFCFSFPWSFLETNLNFALSAGFDNDMSNEKTDPAISGNGIYPIIRQFQMTWTETAGDRQNAKENVITHTGI